MRPAFAVLALAIFAACKPPAAAEASPPKAPDAPPPPPAPPSRTPPSAPSAALPSPAPVAPQPGDVAPDFALTDTEGKTVKLADFAGKIVVLEWFNPGCPFVKYAHDEGPLKTMAKEYAEKGVTWLAVNSSAPGREGSGLARNVDARKQWNLEHPILLDEKGEVGKRYGATRTPEIFVIAADGKLAYHGAPDNQPGGELAEGDGPEPYVRNALDALLAGKPVGKALTQPRGCSVKYPQ